MRHRSLTGPLILITIGLLFLLNNLNPGFSIGAFLSRYWPFLLIFAGVIGLVDVLANAARGETGRRTFHVGWIFLAFLFVCLLAASGRSHFRMPAWGSGGVGIFGAEYDYDVNASAPADGISRVVLDSARGSLSIKGDGDSEVRITGRRTIRAYDRSDADRTNEQSPVRIDRQGDLLIIRTEGSSGAHSITSTVDLDITMPKRLNVEARGRSGDLSIDDVDGSVDLANGRGDVRLSNIGRDVKIEASRSGLIRALSVNGSFAMDGSGGDVQLENISGPATISGEYAGTLEFRNFAKSMHFRSSRTDFRVESIPGSIRMDLHDLKLENVNGPVHFETTSRDIVASDVTGELELAVTRGDIHVTETKTPLPKMDIRSRNGDITLSIPEKSAFDLEGTAQRGQVQNEFGAPLETATEGRTSTIRGSSNGAGGEPPRIVLATDRGTITVEKN